MAVLGAGAFGQVTLVKRQGHYYALKILSKAHIVQTGLQAMTNSSPFECHIAMGIDYIQLEAHICKCCIKSESTPWLAPLPVRIMSCSVLCVRMTVGALESGNPP